MGVFSRDQFQLRENVLGEKAEEVEEVEKVEAGESLQSGGVGVKEEGATCRPPRLPKTEAAKQQS